MNLYKILGLEKTATHNEIKKAYRLLSKKYHPDVGGDPEMFRKIAAAYKILGSPELRLKYDNGEPLEDLFKPNAEEDEAITTLVHLFLTVVNSARQIEYSDLLTDIFHAIEKTKLEFESEKEKIKKQRDKFEKVKKRIKVKKGENIFASALTNQIIACDRNISAIESKLRVGDIMLKMLNDYEYNIEDIGLLLGGTGSSFTIG